MELILRVEEAFRVDIEDAAQRLVAVGDIHVFVCEQLRERQLLDGARNKPCPNIHAFGRLRRALLKDSRLERRQIRPQTPLDELLPSRQDWKVRQSDWQKLRLESSNFLPPLQLSTEAERNIALWFWVPLVSLPLTVLLSSQENGIVLFERLLYLLLACLIVTAIAMGILQLRAAELPKQIVTVGDLTIWTASQKSDASADASKRWTENEIWNLIRVIVADEVCIPIHHVQRESRLVENLGFD